MKLIIFDFDGTLADTRELIVKTMQQTISALELSPRTDEQCASMIGLPLKQALRQRLTRFRHLLHHRFRMYMA